MDLYLAGSKTCTPFPTPIQQHHHCCNCACTCVRINADHTKHMKYLWYKCAAPALACQLWHMCLRKRWKCCTWYALMHACCASHSIRQCTQLLWIGSGVFCAFVMPGILATSCCGHNQQQQRAATASGEAAVKEARCMCARAGLPARECCNATLLVGNKASALFTAAGSGACRCSIPFACSRNPAWANLYRSQQCADTNDHSAAALKQPTCFSQ